MILYRDLSLATMAPAGYGLIEDGAVLVDGARIAWAGPAAERPSGHREIRLGGRLVTPGLIDCHTHLVWAGSRAAEFEQRLLGVSYAEIAAAGGGIRSTVAATRAAAAAELLAGALRRLDDLLAEGVTTVEVKSGYGLETAAEIKLLQVARELGRGRPVTVRTTFLGAHAVPPEFDGDASGYIDHVIQAMLPPVAAAGLADAVDAFCEGIGFSPADTGRLFAAAAAHGLPVKLHADQLSDLGGGALAARFGALSADHLEYLSPDGIAAMAQAGTAAVLLPAAYYFIRETRLPPIDGLRRAGVPIALATDCNPGTAPTTSLLLAVNMGCTLFRLTPAEALAGVTRTAAQALGLSASCGTVEPGKFADLAVWDVDRPAELAYAIGMNRCTAVLRHGHPARDPHGLLG